METVAPGPWVEYKAGQSVGCPALTGPDGAICGRKLREVGAGLVFAVRVRASQGFDRPAEGTTTQPCPRCRTILECREDRVNTVG